MVVRRPVGWHRARAEALVVWCHGEPHARVADQIPADEIRVSAVIGIAKGTLDRVRSNEIEEGRGIRHEAGGYVRLDIAQHCILIGCRER